jgi:hypothetical protein
VDAFLRLLQKQGGRRSLFSRKKDPTNAATFTLEDMLSFSKVRGKQSRAEARDHVSIVCCPFGTLMSLVPPLLGMAVSTQRPSACWCDLAQGCAEDLHERSKAVPHTQRHVSLLFGACLMHVLIVTHAKATKRDFVNKLELAICLSKKAAGPRGCVYSVELYWYPFSPAGMQILCSGGCPRCTDISLSG